MNAEFLIYHIVTGDLAARPLYEAIKLEPAMAGEVVVIRDVLSLGPLQKPEGGKFSDMRGAFWREVINSDKLPAGADDLERVSAVSLAMNNNKSAEAWIWVAPLPADVCTWLWVLKYLGQYTGRLRIVNISGLPFLDEQKKIFFPASIGDIHPKEIMKARKLAREVAPSELENDLAEWQRLTRENAAIRIHDGGKKITSKPETYYDGQLASFCTHQYQKASRLVVQAMERYSIPTGDLYLGWRLRKMAEAGLLELQGDTTKTLKDFELKLPGDGTNAQYSLPL